MKIVSMSGWFTQKLHKALDASAGSRTPKRSRGDGSPITTISAGTFAAGAPVQYGATPTVTAQTSPASAHHNKFDSEKSPSNRSGSSLRRNNMPRQVVVSQSTQEEEVDPREYKRRCYHGYGHDERHLSYSDSAIPPYHESGVMEPHHGSGGYYEDGWNSWGAPADPSLYHHPHHPPHHHPYHHGSEYDMATNDGYHHHAGYYSSYPGRSYPPPPPPPPPAQSMTKSSARFTFARQSSAFSSIKEMDLDDIEVQKHNITSPEPIVPVPTTPYSAYSRSMADSHQAHWHRPVPTHVDTAYAHQFEPPNPHYHHPHPSPITRRMSGKNASCYSSPRNSEYGSTLWSTMKVAQFRPHNPMATLFNYVGNEHKHMTSQHKSEEDYYVVTDHPCDVSEISLDSVFEKGGSKVLRFPEGVDEYPEYREPQSSPEQNGMDVEIEDEGKIPPSIGIPTVPEDSECNFHHVAPSTHGIHRNVANTNRGDDADYESRDRPAPDAIQRIVSFI